MSEQRLHAVIRAAEGLRPSERKVARALLADYPSAALDTVASLAQAAQVSNPTVVRFAKALGFASFAALQEAVRDELRAPSGGPLTKLDTLRVGSNASLVGFSTAIADAMVATLSNVPSVDVEEAVHQLGDSRSPLLCVGGRFSQTLARHLVTNLSVIRPRVTLVADPFGAELALTQDLTGRETVVAFDFARHQSSTTRFVRHAAERGCRIVAITDQGSPIAERARIVLPVSVEGPTPFDSYTPAVVLVEHLITRVLDRLGESGLRRLRAWDHARSDELAE